MIKTIISTLSDFARILGIIKFFDSKRNIIIFIFSFCILSCFMIKKYCHIGKKVNHNIACNSIFDNIFSDDIYHEAIMRNGHPRLWEILHNISNGIFADTQKELVLESYELAAYTEQMIYGLQQEGLDFKVISIVTNKYPSTQWRVDDTEESMKIFEGATSDLLFLTKQRKYYTREQAKSDNVTFIVDYKEDDCKGIDVFNRNIQRYHNLIPLRHNFEKQHGLTYGIYWIIKFKNIDKFYIISSPLSYQIDAYITNTLHNYASCRNYVIMNKNNFQESAYYSYIVNRLNEGKLINFMSY